MLLLQGGGWELKQVVEGVGRDTRKREGQRVGEGAGGSFSAGDCPAGAGAGGGGRYWTKTRSQADRGQPGGSQRVQAGRTAAEDSPITKTGMKAPQGTGMVVASADIQNCRQEVVQTGRDTSRPQAAASSTPEAYLAYQSGTNFPAILESPRGEGKEDSGTRWLGFKSSPCHLAV